MDFERYCTAMLVITERLHHIARRYTDLRVHFDQFKDRVT